MRMIIQSRLIVFLDYECGQQLQEHQKCCRQSGRNYGITEKKKTLAYFPKNSIYQYREFVEDIGHKYIVQEQHIRKMIGEDELWLPW